MSRMEIYIFWVNLVFLAVSIFIDTIGWRVLPIIFWLVCVFIEVKFQVFSTYSIFEFGHLDNNKVGLNA